MTVVLMPDEDGPIRVIIDSSGDAKDDRGKVLSEADIDALASSGRLEHTRRITVQAPNIQSERANRISQQFSKHGFSKITVFVEIPEEKAKQSPLPTSADVTPSAGAPVTPPSSAAGR